MGQRLKRRGGRDTNRAPRVVAAGRMGRDERARSSCVARRTAAGEGKREMNRYPERCVAGEPTGYFSRLSVAREASFGLSRVTGASLGGGISARGSSS